MKRLVSLLGALALAGCLDFDAAREQCKQAGNCLSADAPTITSSDPAAMAADVPVDTGLVLGFSKAMRQDSVNVSISPPVAVGTTVWNGESTSVTLTFASVLATSTTYTVVVTGQANDGSRLADGTQLAFTTVAPPDVVSPTLVATVPNMGATNVPVTSPLTFTFSERMSAASVLLDVAPALELGDAGWSTDGRTLSYLGHAAFAGMTTYQVTLLQARDVAGNDLAGNSGSSFTTGAAPDTEPPMVVSAVPPAGSTGIDFTVAPSVAFSEPMAAGASASLTVALPNGTNFPCTNVFDVSRTVLSCTHPGMQFPGGVQLTVKVATTATDVAGNALAAPFEFAFTTGTMPDVTLPTILGFNPPNGAVGVKPDASVSVVFSEPMNQGNSQQALKMFRVQGGSQVSGSVAWSDGGTILTFRPSFLSYDAGYSVQVDTNAEDLAGNNLATTASSTFGLVRLTRKTLLADPKASGVFESDGRKYTAKLGASTLVVESPAIIGPDPITSHVGLAFDKGALGAAPGVVAARLTVKRQLDAGTSGVNLTDLSAYDPASPKSQFPDCSLRCDLMPFIETAIVTSAMRSCVADSKRTRCGFVMMPSMARVTRVYRGFDGGVTQPSLEVEYETP